MKVLYTVAEVKEYIHDIKKAGQKIGLVPTMGALHEGHLSLMKAAKQNCDKVIASIFVNPVQFGPHEDYDAYPRQFAEDCQKLESAGVDAVFHPAVQEMYPAGYASYVTVDGDLTEKLCGARRPGHFRGVATVVTKLINITEADRAFFGQKDAQQVVVIKRFVRDLNLNVQVEMVPIVRAGNGLALSSRNAYLTEPEKVAALVLSQSLQQARDLFTGGEKRADVLKDFVIKHIEQEKQVQIDYVELYTFPELGEVKRIAEPCLLAIAVKIGKVRLIDNTILEG
ncbi:MAG: pantoate--beta-alanine ligase [Selenomonadaceae bacterium]